MRFEGLLTEKFVGNNTGLTNDRDMSKTAKAPRSILPLKSWFLCLTCVCWAAVLAGQTPEPFFPGHPGAAGRVSGKVWVSGRFEPPKPLRVFKNRQFCGDTVRNESLIVSRDAGLQNAVVLLHPETQQTVAKPAKFVLDNQRCAFTPHVQVAAVGSELLLKNSDPILHTVHARLGKETLFNVGLPRWREVSKRLDREGIIRIDCDVLHTWMSAVVIVTSTPYYSVTDEKGYFSIDGLPAGAYKMEVWHERLGTQNGKVSVGEEAAVIVDVVYAVN